MALRVWQAAEDVCAFEIVLALVPGAKVVIGRTFFIESIVTFFPHQRWVGVSPARFPNLCDLCDVDLAYRLPGESVKVIEFVLPIKIAWPNEFSGGNKNGFYSSQKDGLVRCF